MAARKSAKTKRKSVKRSKPLVLVADRKEKMPILDKPAAKAGLKLVYGGADTPQDIVDLVAKHDPDAIILWREFINAEAISKMNRCRFIVREGIGFDIVDISAASEKGIMVCNVPDYCVEEVATHAIMLMLGLVRDVIFHHDAMKERGWVEYWDGLRMPKISDLTMGIVGLGRIGRHAAKMAKGLGMKRVIAYDPYLFDDVFEAFDVEPCDQLSDLLKVADVVSAHTPLTPETEMMFGAKQFKQMKKGSYFINTSRGMVADLNALDKALASGHLGGAGIDVFQWEPMPTDHPILHRRNVIVSSHMAYASARSLDLVKEEVIDEIIGLFKGNAPLNLVNPEAYANQK